MSSRHHSAHTVVIAGPTGVGKTHIGIEVARHIGGQVLCADSRQIYRGFDIGTAKPTIAERAAVPHHLIDIAAPREPFSAGRFARRARQVAAHLDRHGVTSVVVGGSGMYLAAMIDGLSAVNRPGDGEWRRRWRRRLEEEGVAALYAELGRLDPVAQATLSPRDRHRIVRALERLEPRDGGDAPPESGEDDHSPWPHIPVCVCLYRRRDLLYRRTDRRVVEMVKAGWLEEVEALVAGGCDCLAPAMESLGYGEMARVVAREIPIEEAIAAVQQQTRRYAKRQLTWFRGDRRLRWLDLDRLGVSGAVAHICADWHRRRAGGECLARVDSAC